MGAYEDRRKKQEKKYGGTSSPKTTSSTTAKAASSGESKYLDRRRKQQGNISSVDESFINTFVSDAKRYLDTAESDYNGITFENKDSVYETRKTQWSELRSRSWKIRQYLEQNKDKLDADSYNSFKTYLDDFDKAAISTTRAFYDLKERGFNNNPKYYGKSSKDIDALRSYSDSDIAYTTTDGKNVTWDSLYNNALMSEDLASRLDTYSKNADWAEMSKGIDTVDDTLGDFEIVYGLSQSNVPYDWETAKSVYSSDGYTEAEAKEIFDEEEQKRKYIEEKYGVDLHSDIYENVNIYSGLLSKLQDDEDQTGAFENLSYLTDDEKAVLSYIYNTEGRGAALEWHNSRKDLYLDRFNEGVVQGFSYVGEEHPFWGSAGSVLLTLGSGVEYLTDIFDYMATGETQSNSLALASSSIRSGVSETVNWEIGNWDVFDFLYNTTMSGIDSAAASVLPGGSGSIVLGLSAAAQATNDALDRGMSQGQAFWNGLASGVFEGLFEYWSIGKFKALKEVASAHGWDIAKNIAKSMLTNAYEETLTEIANIMYDSIINGDFSQYETLVRQYVVSGMTEAEAKRKAALDLGGQIVESGASGALMGLGFGVVGSAGPIAYNVASSVNSAKQTNNTAKIIMGADGGAAALVNEAIEINPDNRYAQKMQGRLDSGKHISVGQLARLVRQNEASLRVQDIATIQSAAESRLAELGETGDISAIAKAVAKQAAGERLTRAESKSIADSKYGQQIVDELNPKSTAEWAKSIGTDRINAEEYSHLVEAAQLPKETADVAGDQVSAQTPKTAQAQQTEVAEESRASMNGKTFQKSTGKEVQVKQFSTIGAHDATVVTDSGETVSLSDVSFGDEGEAVLLQSIGSFNHITTEAANTILYAFRSGTSKSSAASFVAGAAHIFNSGYHGIAPTSEYTSKVSDAQVDLIYNAGRKAAADHYKAAQEKVEAKKKASTEKSSATAKNGGVFYEYDGKTIDQRNDGKHKPPTQDLRVAIDFTKRMAKRFGSTVYFYESYKDENGNRVYKAQDGTVKKARNGFYDPKDGSIHIDLNGDHVLFTVSHELVHFIKDWSPKQFKKMADLVMEGFNRQGLSVEELIANKQKEYADYENPSWRRAVRQRKYRR